MRSILVNGLLLLCWVGCVNAAETVAVRTGGTTVRGELLRVTEAELVLKVAGKEKALPVMMVAPADYVACARKLLDAADARGHARLAEFCRKKRLGSEAEEFEKIAASLDPKQYGNKAAATGKPAKQDELGAAELIVLLGDEDANQREVATQKLSALGEKAAPALEKALGEAKDEEKQARIKRLLGDLRYKRELASLTPAEQKLAVLEFGGKENMAPGQLSFHAYGLDTYTVLDVGSLRLAIADQPFNGSSSGTISVGSGGTSSVKAGSLSMFSTGGKTEGSLRGIKFKIESGRLTVSEKDFPIQEERRLVLLKNDGTFEKELRLK